MWDLEKTSGEKSPQGTLASPVQSCVQSDLSSDSSAFLVDTMGAHSILPKRHGLPFFMPKFHATKKCYPLKLLDSPFMESPETHRLFFLSVTLLLITLTAREPVAELLVCPYFITSPDWRFLVVAYGCDLWADQENNIPLWFLHIINQDRTLLHKKEFHIYHLHKDTGVHTHTPSNFSVHLLKKCREEAERFVTLLITTQVYSLVHLFTAPNVCSIFCLLYLL